MNEITIQSKHDLHMVSQRLDFHIFRGQRDDWLTKSKAKDTGSIGNRERVIVTEKIISSGSEPIRLYKSVKITTYCKS